MYSPNIRLTSILITTRHTQELLRFDGSHTLQKDLSTTRGPNFVFEIQYAVGKIIMHKNPDGGDILKNSMNTELPTGYNTSSKDLKKRIELFNDQQMPPPDTVDLITNYKVKQATNNKLADSQWLCDIEHNNTIISMFENGTIVTNILHNPRVTGKDIIITTAAVTLHVVNRNGKITYTCIISATTTNAPAVDNGPTLPKKKKKENLPVNADVFNAMVNELTSAPLTSKTQPILVGMSSIIKDTLEAANDAPVEPRVMEAIIATKKTLEETQETCIEDISDCDEDI